MKLRNDFVKSNIFITREQIEKMKKNSDEHLQKLITQAINIADEALETEALTEEKVRYNGDENHYQNQHEYYYNATRPFVKYMPYLGFAYYYTDDKKYFDKAREFMLMYAGYERWHGKGCYGRAELVTEAFCTGMTYGYEFFKDILDAKEREYIVKRTYELGIEPILEDWLLPGKRLNALDTMGHNWWSLCIIPAGIAAIAMSEDIETADEIAKIVMKGVHEFLNYKGNPIDAKPMNYDNGGYYESIGYNTIGKCAEYLKYYREFLGEPEFDDSDIYIKSADYYINTFYPSQEGILRVPFGDDGGKGVLKTEVFRLLGAGFELPELRWYVKQCKRHDDIMVDISELLYYNEIYNGEAKKPDTRSVVYENIGWAIFRDGFDDDSNMLAVKCGDTWNHAHADAGSFVFYKKGKPVFDEESGVYYGTGAYHGYIVTSKAHNVVLYNGEGQHHLDIHKHARLKGRLYNFVNQDGFKYVAADPTGPMGRFFRRHLRHFLWLDDFVLIYDDITAYEPGELSFLLHGDEESFKMLTPCSAEKKVIYTNKEVNEDKNVTFDEIKDVKTAECMVYSVKTDDECRGKFVGVIPVDEKLVPEFEEIEYGYKIKCGDTKVYINLLSDGRIMHQNCINVMDGIETDAVILVDKKGKYGVVNGSMVRKDGKSYHDTFARANGWVD